MKFTCTMHTLLVNMIWLNFVGRIKGAIGLYSYFSLHCMYWYQMLMEVPLDKPIYAVDTAQNGRLVAVGGAGSKMLLNVIS